MVPSGATAHAAAVAASPTGTLPYLKVTTPNGSTLALSRSNAILRYIAGLREDADLLGATAFDEASVDAWLEWSAQRLEPPLVVLAAANLHATDGITDDELRQRCADQLPPLLAHADAALAHRTFLVGEGVTVADIGVAVALAGAWRTGAECGLPDELTATLPHVRRWLLTCLHQPQFVAVMGPPSLEIEAATGATTTAVGPATPARATKPSKAPAAAGTAAAPTRPSAAAAASTTGLPSALTAVHTALPMERFSRYRQRIADVFARGAACIGQQVTVCGWARTVREAGAGKLFFVALNDGSCFDSLQVVVEKGKTEGFEALAAAGGTGASMRVDGVIVASPAKGQAVEVAASTVTILGAVADSASYPLAKKKHSLEFLRDNLHLRPRTNTIGAVARIRNACAFATHTFFQERGFLYVHTPIITGADCEGAGEMFQVTTLLPADASKPVSRCAVARALQLQRAARLQPDAIRRPSVAGAPYCRRRDRLLARLLQAPRNAHGLGAAAGRVLRRVHVRRLHVRPHVPRGGQPHGATPRGVLDDRTRDCVS